MTYDDPDADVCTPGTVANEAIEFLRSSGGDVATVALAMGIGRSAKLLSQQLAPAARAGLLARRVDAGFALWRLGPNLDKEQAPDIGLNEKMVVKVSALAATSVFNLTNMHGEFFFLI